MFVFILDILECLIWNKPDIMMYNIYHIHRFSLYDYAIFNKQEFTFLHYHSQPCLEFFFRTRIFYVSSFSFFWLSFTFLCRNFFSCLHIYIYIHICVCVVHSVNFQTFLVQPFKIGVDSWKSTMLLLYILWDDWPIFMISGSNEQLQQQLEYTPY